jgi:hypothetical protein
MMAGVEPGSLTIRQDVASDHMLVQPQEPGLRLIVVSDAERELLLKVLDRDRTAWDSHGGLAGLLSLTDQDVSVLKNLIVRIRDLG